MPYIKIFHFQIIFLFFCITICYSEDNNDSYSPPIAITSGKSIFKTADRKIYLLTGNNRRPTLRQLGIVFTSDYIIYDEELKIGYAYGNLRFADPDNTVFMSAEEGTYFVDQKKIVLRKTPEILLGQDKNTSTKIIGKIITIYPEESYVHVQGNIEINDGSTFITGKEAKIWTKDDRMLITGTVQSISEDQKLTADTLDVTFADGGLSTYKAQGNVKVVNNIDNFTLCTTILTYNNKEKLFRATENPSLYFQKDRTISFANVIEYNSDTKFGNLIGDVISIQDTDDPSQRQKAYSRWAVFDGNSNIINMYGNPRLVQKDSELFGMQIIININSNNMHLIGGGQGIFNRTE